MANVERKECDKSCLKDKPIVWVMGLDVGFAWAEYNLRFFSSGGPGSGRGTQCEMIHLKCGYKHISSGDLLRHEVMSGTNRGGQLYKLMSSGETVPNSIIDDLIAEAMVAAVEKSKVREKVIASV